MPKYLCALLALAAAAAAGCGGGPSKEEYAADLNDVCKTTNEKVQKLKAPRTIKGIGSFARQTRPILEDSIKEAQGLELPDEQGDQFKAYVQSSKSSLSELDDLEKAADAGDTRAIRRVLVKTAQENKKRDVQAKKLGLDQCGTS